MSQENVEIVRRAYASAVDIADADEALIDRLFSDYFDDDWEYRMPADYPEGEQIFRGRAGFAQWSAWLRGAWGKWRFEAERLIDLGDRVLVLVRIVAEGEASGVPIVREVAHVQTICDGRIVRTEVYRQRSEALEALGLRVADVGDA
jgi:ketosteroid isomerase-like protein